MGFSRNSNFYYGLRGEAPPSSIDFVTLAIHEIIHGLGFHSSLGKDGSFPSETLDVTGGAQSFSLDIEQWQRIYDVQMYSEEDGEFIVSLNRTEESRPPLRVPVFCGTELYGRGGKIHHAVTVSAWPSLNTPA